MTYCITVQNMKNRPWPGPLRDESQCGPAGRWQDDRTISRPCSFQWRRQATRRPFRIAATSSGLQCRAFLSYSSQSFMNADTDFAASVPGGVFHKGKLLVHNSPISL